MANTRRVVVVVLVVSSVAAAMWLRVRAGATASASQPPQTSSETRPFIAIRSDVNLIPGQPSPMSTEIRTIAVRTDGSNVELLHRRDPSGSGKTVYIRSILDVPGRQRIVVDPISESLITYPLADAVTSAYRVHPVSKCAGVPAGQILGYDVNVEETSLGPEQAGPAVDEMQIRAWRAARLNCLPLRREMTIFKGGQESQRIVESVVTVTEGEPDPSLFEIPQGYVERQPSEAMAESARRYPNDKDWQCPNCSKSQANKDQAYFHAWKHRQTASSGRAGSTAAPAR